MEITHNMMCHCQIARVTTAVLYETKMNGTWWYEFHPPHLIMVALFHHF